MTNTPNLVYLNLRGDSPSPLPAAPEASILCLGNFDGVHIAHAALLREGLRLRRECLPDGLCGVFCFFSPTVDYFPEKTGMPGLEGTHLTTFSEKLRLFSDIGLDFVCLCEFSEIRHLSPDEFLSLLEHQCHCRGAVCGFNYRFGEKAAGTAEQLKAYFEDRHRPVSVLPPFRKNGWLVSATEIRRCLTEGDPVTARMLLGRPYGIEETVVSGKQLGRTIGFPTANQFFAPERLIPAHGVYVSLCHTPYGLYTGVSNVGQHPTVDEKARVNCETFLLHLNRDLYGQKILVEFLQYLRPEQRFDSLDALTDAIRRDAEDAERYLTGYRAENGAEPET